VAVETATPNSIVPLVPTALPTETTVPPTSGVPPRIVSPTSNPTEAPSTPVAQPTLDPVLVAEVTKAFDQYWQVRSQALMDLDKSHLAEIMAGDHLAMMSQRINQLREENRAIKTDVDHEIRVLSVSMSTAQVFDDYISNTVYVDPVTAQPLSQPASDELRVVYRLEKSDGRWKVIDSVIAD
jgi:hypothetical protein